MKFEKLSKSEKIKYWKDVESDIAQCLEKCRPCLLESDINQIKEYLDHNELGLAHELLTDTIIENECLIANDIKTTILKVFEKMEYNKTDVEQFESYLKNLKTHEHNQAG